MKKHIKLTDKLQNSIFEILYIDKGYEPPSDKEVIETCILICKQIKKRAKDKTKIKKAIQHFKMKLLDVE